MRQTSAAFQGMVAAFAFVAGCQDAASRGHGAADACPSVGCHAAEGGAGLDASSDTVSDAAGAAATPEAGARDANAFDAGRSDRDSGRAHQSDGGTTDGSAPVPLDAGATDASGSEDGGSPPFVRLPGWSVRKRVHRATGGDLVLEETLASFTVAPPGLNRIQSLGGDGQVQHSFDAPPGTTLSDFCVHPSGQLSAVLIDAAQVVSLVRLDRNLVLLATSGIHDPDVPNDAPGVDGAPTDLFANDFARDSARIASAGEDVVAVVYSSFFSVIAYRASFVSGAWSSPKRTLVEPPRPLTPFLPIGGTFDTFGAIAAWFRAVLDTDEDGNAYVAIWSGQSKLKAHVAAFHDALTPLDTDPAHAADSDILLTRINRDGTRAWSRVIGTENEDEPYAIRASRAEVAVVGRSRRLPGFDNTFWDAFVGISTDAGELVGSRALSLDASSIFLAVDRLPGGTWVLGGSDGWSQNPDGLSVASFGTKLVVELTDIHAPPLRRALPPGPRHNEIRTLSTDSVRIWYGGHEDGPVMHTGDDDLTLIHATGVLGALEQ